MQDSNDAGSKAVTRGRSGHPLIRRLPVVAAAVPLILAHCALVVLWDPLRSGTAFLVIMAAAFLGLYWACRWLRGVDVPTTLVLGVAVVLRLIVLPLPPSLSDDIYRYVWDGKVALAGSSPYALAPEAEELAPLRDEIWENVAHREVETVYPPVALGLFSIAAALPAPLLVLKVLVAAADLVGCWLLVALARRLGLGAAVTLGYAWNPLVVVETAGMGHVDSVGAAAVVATVLLLCRLRGDRRASSAVGAGLLAAAGVLIKLVPLVALPHWLRVGGRRTALAAAAALLIGVAPMVLPVGGAPPGLVTYGVSWEFNGPVFEPLHRLVRVTGATELVKGVLELAKHVTGAREALDRLFPYVYPQTVAKAVLGVVMVVLIARSLRERDPVRGTGELLCSVLLLSATLYPWYLIWALPWAALLRRRAWLVLAASIQVAYAPRLFGSEYFPWVYLAVWLPFAAAWWTERMDPRRGEGGHEGLVAGTAT